MRYLYKKELELYFSTPFGCVFLGIFLLMSGIMFTIYNLVGGNGDMAGTFDLLKNLCFMVFPVLTMRSFAEERRSGTELLLTTSKLSSGAIVMAKYFAAMTVFLTGLVITLIYVAIICRFGSPNAGALAASYLGFLLLGAAMIALCLLASSFSESQITAAVISFGALFALVLLASLSRSLNVPVLTPLLSALSITAQYDDFTLGVLDLGAVVYYLAFSGVCLFLTVKNLQRRRFS